MGVGLIAMGLEAAMVGAQRPANFSIPFILSGLFMLSGSVSGYLWNHHTGRKVDE
jgi:hypothetical protein